MNNANINKHIAVRLSYYMSIICLLYVYYMRIKCLEGVYNSPIAHSASEIAFSRFFEKGCLYIFARKNCMPPPNFVPNNLNSKWTIPTIPPTHYTADTQIHTQFQWSPRVYYEQTQKIIYYIRIATYCGFVVGSSCTLHGSGDPSYRYL